MAQVQTFEKLAEQAEQDPASAQWVQEFRHTANANFKQLSPPTSRDERYRYLSLRDLFATQYHNQPEHLPSEQAMHIAQQYQGHVYVFSDGMLAATANPLPAPLQFASIKQLMAVDNADNKTLLQFLDTASTDYFQQLNSVCFQDGAHIVIPAKTRVDAPIHLVYVSSTNSQAVCYRNIIVAQDNSDVRIVEHYRSANATNDADTPHFTNAYTQLYLRPAAQCSYIKLQSDRQSTNHISMCDIHQQQDSKLQMFALAYGGKLTRMSANITKEGEATAYDFRYGYLGSGRQTFDCVADVEHRQPQGKTNQLVRGIVKDQAKGIFTGKINVLKEAQKTSAAQQSKNILIGKKCEVYMRPQLQIKADDVECSHGAASSKFDASSLLYLRSRGIQPAIAMRLISEAHLGALLEGFKEKSLVEGYLRQASAEFWQSYTL